jgi:hypothetical protein
MGHRHTRTADWHKTPGKTPPADGRETGDDEACLRGMSTMLQRLKLLALAGGLGALAACSSGETISPGSAPAPSSARSAASISVSPDKACGGVRGVSVTPCPLRLTKHSKSGVVVTVGGPGVVHSSLGRINSCYSGYECFNAARNGDGTHWLITSGTYCGGGILEFLGKNSRHHVVGYAFLEIRNKYCS